jgi:hypothetical protein
MATQKRIDAIISHLQGTCNTLNSALTEKEQTDIELLNAIDDAIFECDTCGWWCEMGAENCATCCERTGEETCNECCICGESDDGED